VKVTVLQIASWLWATAALAWVVRIAVEGYHWSYLAAALSSASVGGLCIMLDEATK
jgi:hypothetical protein